MDINNLLLNKEKNKDKDETEGISTKYKNFKAGLNSAIKFF